MRYVGSSEGLGRGGKYLNSLEGPGRSYQAGYEAPYKGDERREMLLRTVVCEVVLDAMDHGWILGLIPQANKVGTLGGIPETVSDMKGGGGGSNTVRLIRTEGLCVT